MKRIFPILILAVALVACQKSGPTAPNDSEREAKCFDSPDSCVWSTEGVVKVYGRAIVLPGAKGTELLNSTQESHTFQTDASGSTGRYTWRRFKPNSTLRVTIDRGVNDGLAWSAYDRNDIVPVCSADPSITNGMLCRWVAELQTSGIGAAGRE